jgi:hypothetical protein
MTRTFCDGCGKEEPQENLLSVPIPETGIQDRPPPFSGAVKDLSVRRLVELCPQCTDLVSIPAYKAFKRLQFENGVEGS